MDLINLLATRYSRAKASEIVQRAPERRRWVVMRDERGQRVRIVSRVEAIKGFVSAWVSRLVMISGRVAGAQPLCLWS